MSQVASWFVHRPLSILLVAALFVVAFLTARGGLQRWARRPEALLVPAAGWALFALWEWLVMTLTPEANIRVDLLVIWPVLSVLSIVSVFLTLRARK